MPHLTLQQIAKEVESAPNRLRVTADLARFLAFNGKLRGLIEKAISKEFIKPETIEAMNERIVPINLVQKIIKKLGKLYNNPPQREPIDMNDLDMENISVFEDVMSINKKMKFANEMFKLDKNVMLEPFLNSDGLPRLRILPAHQYTVFGTDPLEPEIPTIIVKHLKFKADRPKDDRFAVWTKENHWIIDGEGAILMDEMIAMNNEKGINPFGVLPFVYINESETSLVPISDDDLFTVQIIVNLLLTDLAFATKFLSWGILVIIGELSEKISFNPNSVLNLPFGPEGQAPSVDTVKPELDSDSVLRFVEALIAMLLSTKSLSIGSVSNKLVPGNPASGIALMIENAETTEDRKDQIAVFDTSEKKLWNLLAHHMQPVWRDSGKLDAEFAGLFTEDFELMITYPDLKPPVSDMEKIDLILKKMNGGLTTLKRSILAAHPNMTDEQADELIEEIKLEKLDNIAFFTRNMNNNSSDEEENEEEEGSSHREEDKKK